MDSITQRRCLLIILYLSFISLGLPDAILGVAWPEMRGAFEKTMEHAGILLSMTTLISVGASLATGFFTARWSTGLLITACGFTTAAAMFGYGASATWGVLLFFTFFFGIGQGAVDTAVNAYMARTYSARHMNWVHCCWGMGATGGPLIMTAVFSLGLSWRSGYAAIALVQLVLSLIFLFTLKLWRPHPQGGQATGPHRQPVRTNADTCADTAAGTDLATGMNADADAGRPGLSRNKLLAAGGAGILFYFLYPGIELVTGLWGASYLVENLGASPAQAAISITLFWMSLAAGRFLTGLLAARFPNVRLLRMGLLLAICGALLMATGGNIPLCRLALLLIGLGLSPLYPTMMHDTPRRVGRGYADRLIGFQVGAALAGSALLPVLAGFTMTSLGLPLFGCILMAFAVLVLAAHEISLRNSLLSQKTF